MSTTVDQRVVEMRFDNKHFESNVSTTMSTLDKLKQRLNLNGATKGLENINTATKNVNMSGLGAAVETVSAKFSALQVMGVTALANITNSAVNAGKRMVSALTIDPVKTGFSEYETKINAIQTIKSNTSSKGTTMEDITRTIDELNTYADKTIYNFAEMTRNIGTFTAAGVGLEESAAAIQGIANLAAASGSNSQQASTAMYQLSQALAAGTVKLMDWNSVVNAGMGGEKFQEALKATAREQGIAVDDMIEKNGSFRESLQEGWISADVLNTTLQKFTVEGAKEYAKSMMESGKWTQKEADALLKEAENMENAATKVKTFTQLCDTLKESLQSGWGKTWELIFGDFDEAQDLWSRASDFLSGFIDKMSDFRNMLIGGALNISDPWGAITEKLGLKKIEEVSEKVADFTDKLTNFQDIVNKVWKGDYGNSDTGRYEKLEAAGYDHRVVQDLVNKGYDYKITVEDIEASHKKFGLTLEKTKTETKDTSKALELLSDEELKNAKLTDAEIKLYKDLAEEAKRSGKSIQEVVDDMSKTDGRTLLIDSFKNVGSALVSILTAIKDAWVEIFPPMSVVQLYGMIKSLNDFTEKIKENCEDTEDLKRTLKGVFALIDIIATLFGGAFKFGLKIVNALLSYFNMDILDLTGNIGDAIVKFRDWLDSILDVQGAVDKIMPKLEGFVKGFKEWWAGLKETDNIPKYILQGLVNGIIDGAPKVWNALVSFVNEMITKAKEILGIHSPSTVFMAIGAMCIAGLLLGLKNFAPDVYKYIETFGKNCLETLSNLDLGSLFAVAISGGMFLTVKKLVDVLEMFASPFEGLGDMLDNIGEGAKKMLVGLGKMFKGVGKYFNALAWEHRAKAIMSLAIAIGILVGSLVVLNLLPDQGLNKALGTLGILTGIIVALAGAAALIAKTGSIGKASASLLAISGSLLIMAMAFKMVSKIDTTSADNAYLVLAGFAAIIAILMMVTKMTSDKDLNSLTKMLLGVSVVFLVFTHVAKSLANMNPEGIWIAAGFLSGFVGIIALLTVIGMIPSKYIDKLSSNLLKISGAMLIMTVVAKMLSNMTYDDMKTAAIGIAGILVTITMLTLIGMIPSKRIDKLSSNLLRISGAFLLLAFTAKIIGTMDETSMKKAGIGLVAFLGVVASLAAIGMIPSKHLDNIGRTILAISGALLILSIATLIAGSIKDENFWKAIGAVALLAVITSGLVLATKLAAKEAPKIAITLLAMSISIGLLAGIAAMLGLVPLDILAKGVVAVGLLGLVMAAMIAATRGAQDCMKNLIVMTVAITLMAAAIGILATLPMANVLSSAAALASVMVAFGGIFVMIGSFAGVIGNCVKPVIIMTVVMVIMAGLLYLLATLPIASALQASLALSTLLVAMTAAMVIISKFGTMSAMTILSLAVMTIVVWALAEILKGLAETDPSSAMPNVLALTTLLLGMSVVLGVLTVIGLGGPAALIGVASLVALIAALAVAIGGLGALVDTFPQLETFVDKGIPILEKLGLGLGKFVGNIVGGLLEGITNTLPAVGENLSKFMENIGKIDPAAVEGGKALVEMIMLLTAASLLQGITSFITGGSSVVTFSAQLIPFGYAMVTFSSIVSGNIDEGAVMAAANAGKILAEMAATIPNTGGVVGWFMGENDMVAFGNQLKPFGEAMVAFSSSVAGKIDEGAVTAAANAGKTMVEMAKTIPNSGGVVGWFTGENDIDTFGQKLVPFGKAMVEFSTSVAGKIDQEAVTAAANAGSIMVELANKIPNTGGIVTWFTGDNDIADFGAKLVSFGGAMVTFSNTVAGKIDGEAVTAAANAGEVLVSVANAIPNSGGIKSWWEGDNSMSNFSTQITKFGEGIKSFSDEVKDISTSKVTAATKAIKTITDMARGIADVNFKGLKSFGDSLKSISKTGVDNFIKGFEEGHTKVSDAGGKLLTKLIDGMKKKAKDVKDAAKEIAESAKDAIRDKHSSFKTAGSYVVSGFSSGITENTFAAEAAATAMAEAALEAAKEALREKSPSRAFYDIGDYAGLGFVNALNDYEPISRDAAYEMADSARRGLSDAIKKVSTAINSDMDTQPTIRPVMDLSEVNTGIKAVNKLFSNGTTMGVLANVSDINARMNRRSQNGANDEVVSEIRRLRKDVGSMERPSYNLNGVTYEESSDVAEAFQTIVRAAKIERRT